MRVLHIGKFYPPYAGGIERFSAELCAALAARSVDVMMLAHASPGNGRARSFRNDGVEVRLAACHGQLLYAPVSPSFPLLLSRLIGEFAPDLLHLHVPNTSAFWALLTPAARRLPWLVHWHADVPLDVRRPALRAMYSLYRPFEQALLQRADTIIATSAPYRDTSAALAPWRSKTHVVPLGIGESPADDSSVEKMEIAAKDTSAQSTAWPGTGLRLLAVGRLSYYKGFDVLLRALALTPEASLLLIGSGECEAGLRALARELGIEHRVCFAGHVDDAQLALAYAQAQVFCLPSIERTEAFGVVLLEAMSHGVPIIATDIPGSGVPWVVEHERSALVVPPADPHLMAEAMDRILGDSAVAARLAEGARARFASLFTRDRMVTRFLASLEADRAPADRA